MSRAITRMPSDRPPSRDTSKHVFDLYGVYISLIGTIADTERSARPSPAIDGQVLHKVIHRQWMPFEAPCRRAARGARLAGRDARALEWRVRRHAERPKALPRAAHCTTLRERIGCCRCFTSLLHFSLHLSIVRRTALMLAPRLAPSASTPPSRLHWVCGVSPVLAAC
jgi:hypothetical protein